jgi:hypothetical protein
MDFAKLISLANRLDKIGQHSLADEIDSILKLAVEEWQYHGFKSEKDYDDFLEGRGKKRTKDVVKEEPKSFNTSPKEKPHINEAENILMDISNVLLKVGHNYYKVAFYTKNEEHFVVSCAFRFADELALKSFVNGLSDLGFNVGSSASGGKAMWRTFGNGTEEIVFSYGATIGKLSIYVDREAKTKDMINQELYQLEELCKKYIK